MIDTRFTAPHLYRHKRSGKGQNMSYVEKSRGPVNVGRTTAAQEMNCTDEEAQILTRNLNPYSERSSRFSGPVWSLLQSLILNPGAALFFGTIGYWFFGLLMVMWAQQGVSTMFFLTTGFRPLDMLITNPFVMTALSFVLVVIGLRPNDDENGNIRGALWYGLGAMVMMISLPVAYLGSMLMGAIFFITLPFALGSTEPYDMGMFIMFLIPGGYLAAVKMNQEL